MISKRVEHQQLLEFDPVEYIEEVSHLSVPKNTPVPNERDVGRKAYAFSEQEDAIFSFTQAEARDLLLSNGYKESEDFTIESDAIGNLYIVVFGDDRSTNTVCCSHLDSVGSFSNEDDRINGTYGGGKYDGVAGIASGMQFLSALVHEKKKPKTNFTIVVFRSEESSPTTGQALLGSKVALGTITPENLESIQYSHPDDASSIPLSEHLEHRYGKGKWQDVLDQLKSPPFIDKFGSRDGVFELHIEQSRFGIENGKIGVVNGVVCGAERRVYEILHPATELLSEEITEPFSEFELDFKGVAAHTGATPHNASDRLSDTSSWYREDALVASSRVLHCILDSHPQLDIRVTRFDSAGDTGFSTVPELQKLSIAVPSSQSNVMMQLIKLVRQRTLAEQQVDVSFSQRQISEGTLSYYHKDIASAFSSIPLVAEQSARNVIAENGGGYGMIRATVSKANLQPGRASWQSEIRVGDLDQSEQVQRYISDGVRLEIAKLGIDFEDDVSQPQPPKISSPAQVSKELARLQIAIAEKLQIDVFQCMSGAGHDCASFVHRDPSEKVSMIFVPHQHPSHNPREDMDKSHFWKAMAIQHSAIAETIGVDDFDVSEYLEHAKMYDSIRT